MFRIIGAVALTMAIVTCDLPTENQEKMVTEIKPSVACDFPLVVGNSWVYTRLTSDMSSSKIYRNDTLYLKIIAEAYDTFTFEERIISHSTDIENRISTYRVSIIGDRIVSTDTTGLFAVPLCVDSGCIDTLTSPTTGFYPRYENDEWSADSVFKYNDLGNVPVDGCGGLAIYYSMRLGIIDKNDYCGWNVSSRWILQW